MAKIFNRKDPQVRHDAIELTEEGFFEAYEDTSADKLVLKSVYKHFEVERKQIRAVASNTTTATEFVAPIVEEEIIDSPEKLKAFNDSLKKVNKGQALDVKVVKGINIPAVKEEKVVKEKPVKEGEDKPGRTPRMREMMKEHGREDKSKIKRLLTEEGFNCEGSGFHSEWNRVKKSFK